MTVIKLPHIYRARDYQKDFWDALHGEGKHKGKKYWLFVLIWHRRGGKDLTSWNAAIEHGAENIETIKYGFPTGEVTVSYLYCLKSRCMTRESSISSNRLLKQMAV